MDERPTLAVWKFSSCDGCQLSLLDVEDDLLAIAASVQIAHFLEASSATVAGPYDVSLVEGSITTPEEAERIKEVRAASRMLVTIGACATAGGIQALRNYAQIEDYVAAVYASPEYISTLATSTAIADHVDVDFELRGCPINKQQLVELVSAMLHRRRPNIATHSVCVECKSRGIPCVMVSHGIPCLGPVTQAGCGAICPAYNRGCFGCFGPPRPRTWRPSRPGGGSSASTSKAFSGRYRPSTWKPSGGSVSTPTRRTIKTDYLARVEGEGAMSVRIVDGRVDEVELRIFEPPRFFEALLRGRSFLEAPDITSRICGICPVAYQMSSINAMEDLCGVEVSEPIRILRRLLYCGEWIESHALHVYMLHAPDFLGYAGRRGDGARARRHRPAGSVPEEDGQRADDSSSGAARSIP